MKAGLAVGTGGIGTSVRRCDLRKSYCPLRPSKECTKAAIESVFARMHAVFMSGGGEAYLAGFR